MSQSNQGSHSITVTESRLLPGILGSMLLAFAGLVMASDAPSSVRLPIGITAIVISGWPVFRCVCPRWIFRLCQHRLYFRDVFSRQIVQFDLANVSAANLKEKSMTGGAEGGIGWEKVLILETKNGKSELRFPRLAIPVADVHRLIEQQRSQGFPPYE